MGHLLKSMGEEKSASAVFVSICTRGDTVELHTKAPIATKIHTHRANCFDGAGNV